MTKPSREDVLKVVGEPVAFIWETAAETGVQRARPHPNLGVAVVPLYTEAQLLAMYAAGAEWKEAVLDQCAVVHSAFYEDDPKKTLDTIIDWHVMIALDPLVSSDAAALIAKGAEDMRKLTPMEAIGKGETP